MNVEEMLRELVKYSRDTTDQVKVDKMTRVIAAEIDRALRRAQLSGMSAQMALVDEVVGGHA